VENSSGNIGTVTVTDAACDWTTDDTVSIQRAIDEAKQDAGIDAPR
jgi:hypothetical protein